MVRLTSLAAPPARGGPEYAQGLREAIVAAVRYTIEGIAQAERELPPVPEPVLAQARRALRTGVGLDTVLRRCLAGHALLNDFVVEEAEGRVTPAELTRAMRGLASALDCLLAAVTAAYRLEQNHCRRTREDRRAELVDRLLVGEPLDASELAYGLDAHHLGMLACGAKAAEALSPLATSLEARLLAVRRDQEEVWAWLGTRAPLDPDEVRRLAAATLPSHGALALGEPGQGRQGWRLTHRQARAAFSLARNGPEPCVRYAEVALLAAVLRDDLLTTSLRRLYLKPLEGGRDGGAVLRETLRAYFAAGLNGASAAKALGVSRQTVSHRLQAAEECIGRPLLTSRLELDTILRLAEREDDLNPVPA
jgi:hypothetical protein